MFSTWKDIKDAPKDTTIIVAKLIVLNDREIAIVRVEIISKMKSAYLTRYTHYADLPTRIERD